MATAANHRIIIEKGSDFQITIQVSDNGIDMKDLNGYTVEMTIQYQDTEGLIQVLDTIAGVLVPDEPGGHTYLNGYFKVVIDKSTTAGYPTRVSSDLNQFITEYNYNYHIDITENSTVSVGKENLRVLRGKCAVRV